MIPASKIGQEVIAALGLSEQLVQSVKINLDTDDVITATVVMVLSIEQLHALGDVFCEVPDEHSR